MASNQQYYSEFGYYIHQIVTLIDKRGDRLFRDKLGISLNQFMLLRIVGTTPDGMSSQQLVADRLGIAKSAVSRHVDIARRKGWLDIGTSTLSRRENTLSLTTSGKDLLAAAQKLIAQSEQTGFGDLPAEDVKATLRTLKSLHEKLKTHK